LALTLTASAQADITLPEALNATNLTWWNPGQPGWQVETTNTHDGFAAAGIALTNSQADTPGLQAVVTGPGMLDFWYQAPPAGGFINLYFSVDEALTSYSSGQSSNWINMNYYVPAGRHILLWSLGNSSPVTFPAKAYLDQVTFVPGLTAPLFASQPLSQTNAAGNNVTFSSSAVGTPPMNYQWYFNSTLLPGAISSSLTLNNVQAANIGAYQLIVSNDGGFVGSSNAYLMVTPSAPTITAQPVGISTMLGASASFGPTVQGTTPLFFQWLNNNSPIPGATNSTLTINNVQNSDNANYSLFVSNSIGTTVSSNALLSVYSPGDFSSAVNNSAVSWNLTTNVPWFPETNTTHDGISAVQSGIISGSQQSTLQGVVTAKRHRGECGLADGYQLHRRWSAGAAMESLSSSRSLCGRNGLGRPGAGNTRRHAGIHSF
jgi:hypothetical protein